jgi:stromal membrane-associated protein
MRKMGNLNANAIYNPDERRHPPPTNMEESERDSEMEKYIRGKYEYKRFMDRGPLPPAAEPEMKIVVPPSRAKSK